MQNGFQDWSWAPRNLNNSSPVHSGTESISVTASAWEGLSFWHQDLNAPAYTNLTFWINGGTAGGQKLQVYAEYGTNSGPAVQLASLQANAWQLVQIPLGNLGVATRTNLNRFSLQLTSNGSAGTFYVDDVQLVAKPAPLVHLTVNADQPIRTAEARWFGLNTAVWDPYLDTVATVSILKEMGTRILRFPGGSLSDEYHWASNKSSTNSFQWASSFGNFMQVATNTGSQAFITVNYGSGTAAEAAGWVRHANVTNHVGFRYWEIGNESYGTWETDTNISAHDPYTYAVRAADYFKQMKAADPSIKVGVPAVPGEDNFSNGYTSHPALNPRTGQRHNGWVPVMLSTLKSMGVKPDFLVHHRYPEYTNPSNPTGTDSDSFLLQFSTAWFGDASDLRQQIADYFGSDGTNMELLCTENNSDAGAQGRQSTSLVNGLYFADSMAQLMKSEFNSFVWWDLRNGTDTSGSFDANLYGWRTYGDLGVINGLNTRHPTFYAAKLMRSFVQPGDTVVNCSSDYPFLSAYAVRNANGSLSLLVLHKDTSTNFNAQISLNGFLPGNNATLRTYGIPQDEAARTNAPVSAQDISTNQFLVTGTNFNYSFKPLSASLFTFVPDISQVPAAPRLGLIPPGATGSQLTLRLYGQPGTSYIIQSASELNGWVSIATNVLATGVLDLSYPVGPSDRYWRALWLP